MKNIRIIIATHKKYRMPKSEMYTPVQVGAEGKASLCYYRDNKGDNISEKNPSYCELTGLYWAWKNVDADFLGLVHYRRHFTNKSFWQRLGKDKFECVLTREEASALTEEYDVILPRKRRYYIESLYSHYAHTHYSVHLDETRKIIKEIYPDYLSAYDKVINQRSAYMFNMMIMKKEHFDSYCEWLFNILFELEKRTSTSDLSDFQGRFYGRVSEILFNVWLSKQISDGKISSSKVKTLVCIHMEKINWFKKGSAFISAKLFGKKYEGSF